jgi:hypothetical protein
MIPSVFVFMDSLPLAVSGKVDRERLQAPNWEQLGTQVDSVAPRSPIEEKLGELWGNVLGLGRVGIHDNFFEAGGHSLLATQFMSRLNATFAMDLPLRTLFEQPTIEELALVVTRELLELATPQGLIAILESMKDRSDQTS